MRIAFMGTPKFAADILNDISQSVDIACVFTAPDKVRGRGSKVSPSPVKLVAEELGLEVYCPTSLKDDEVIDRLEGMNLDAICVAAYGKILPKAVLDIPKYGCLNVHASLLPRWRGAAPIERAILAADEQVGVCIMRMEEGLDTGDFCVRRSIPVGDMSAPELTDELASLGAQALIVALDHLERECVKWTSQDEVSVTYAEKIGKGELFLEPKLSVYENARRVQASSDAHPAKCHVGNREITVLKSKIAKADDNSASKPNSLEDLKVGYARSHEGKLCLGCIDGVLEVSLLKPQGKREMLAKDFMQGFPDIRKADIVWRQINA